MDLLTVSETARLLGVSPSTVRTWGRRGVLTLDSASFARGTGRMLFPIASLFSPLLPACPNSDLSALGALEAAEGLRLRRASRS